MISELWREAEVKTASRLKHVKFDLVSRELWKPSITSSAFAGHVLPFRTIRFVPREK